jgi:hypothetical protein
LCASEKETISIELSRALALPVLRCAARRYYESMRTLKHRYIFVTTLLEPRKTADLSRN